MQAIAGMLDAVLNKDLSDNKYGFVLLVIEREGDMGSKTNYVSNCQRADILVALKEITARFEGQAQQSGRG